MFAGIDNKARKSTGAYIGVDGVARRAKKLYMGVDGKARLCWEAGGGESDRVRAYLYNGVKLPPLPQWDKAAYPYALVAVEEVYSGRWYAILYVFSSVNYFTSEDNGNWCISANVSHGSRFFAKGASIEALQPFDEDFKYSDGSDGGIAITRADWANFDVLNEAGGVYLAASEPVPVYE